MQAIITALPNDKPLEPLVPILELATSTLTDSHFKVSQLGLELIARIVAKAGMAIKDHLPSLVQSIMGKVGSNKFVLKVAGSQVITELMIALGPRNVIKEVLEYGLGQKTSRVREETLNVVTMALLTFPITEFDMQSIITKAVPSMLDSKSRVRQASFETIALVCSRDPDSIKDVITAVVNQRKSITPKGTTLMDALQTRLAREATPRLSDNGLVEHGVNATSSSEMLSGLDIDWIQSAGTKAPPASESSEQSELPKPRKTSVNGSSSRPYRSAGKRLPWEIESEYMVRSHLANPLAPLPNTHSPKLPPQPLPTPKKKSYTDMYLSKMDPKPLSIGHPPSTGAPLFTPRHSSIGDDRPIQPNASMSVTWPRIGGFKSDHQITADTSKLTGVHSSVKTSMSRPLSKPRVRNPLNAIKPTRDSPTQLEREFLSSDNDTSQAVPTGWGENSWDEEYFNTIPEDVAILNSSLSSSLSSLRGGDLDTTSEVDKLKHIRKEAASRKAQLISAATSASNSPECSRQSSGEAKGRPSNQPTEVSVPAAPIKKPKRPKPQPQQLQAPAKLNASIAVPTRWLSDDSTDNGMSLNRTYNPEKTYSNAFSSRKLTTPPKSFKASHTQRDRERLLAEGSKVLSKEEPEPKTKEKRRPRKDVMMDIEITGQKQPKPVEGLKTQSANLPSNKPPLPPAFEEPTVSAPPERKRSKPKKTSPPKPAPPPELDDSVMEVSLTGELQPFSSADAGYRDSMQGLDSEDWNSKVEGIIGIRRLAMFHSEALIPRLQPVLFAIEKEVKNLRSSVARAAIVCFGDLFALLGAHMEKDLDSAVKVLLHKGAESNTFIREDVDKALGEMVDHLSHSKCLTALINGGLSHRNTQVRKNTARHICMILESQGASRFLHTRELLERSLSAIVQLATDSSADARYYGKRCLHQLWPLPDYDRISARVLSAAMSGKAKEVIDNLRAKGLGDPPPENHSAKSRHSIGSNVRGSSNKPLVPDTMGSTKKRRQSSTSSQPEPVEAVPLPDGLLERLKSSNWNERYDAVAELEDFVNAYPKALSPYVVKVFDAFCPRLTDRNSKVNLRALEVFSNIVPLLCDTLSPVTTSIVTALVPNLASRNATIHSNAMTALDLLLQCIDPASLVQPVANSAQFGNARVKPIMINKLADLTSYVCEQKPQLVTRQVLPVLWSMVNAKTSLTGDTRSAAIVLCGALLSAIGYQQLIDSAAHLSPEANEKLNNLISSHT